MIDPLHVVVQFGRGIPSSIQGPAMLAFEQALRRYAVSYLNEQLWIEVFKENKGDDSRLRANMTKEQRAAL